MWRVWRKVRIVYNWLRGYNFTDPARNGEYRFLRRYLEKGIVVFDVGANVGDYSRYILQVLENDVELHCFEPVSETFAVLQDRFGALPNVHLNNFGLSDRSRTASIKIYESSGLNSLHERRSAVAQHPGLASFSEEVVTLSTLDAYIAEQSVKRIDLLKIDVEGHEAAVLKGATHALASGLIKCIQFEYGSTWVDAQSSLREVYDLLMSHGYQLFRLLPFGTLRIRSFDPVYGLENYQHSNWVALLTASC